MKILIAEDERVSRRMLEATLVKWGYEVVAARDGNEAWELLQQEDAPSLVLLDWMMPGLNGPEICQKLRRRNNSPYVYIVLLTARSQKEELVQGLDAGADDYMTKPFDSYELKARLRTGRRILDLQEHLVRAREALWVQATHDPLTGLWNRGAILDILKKEMDRAERQRATLGVILADMDHFKNINDSHGHLAGDEVLRETARRFLSVVRSYDAVGRYGGEEFLIVVPDCDVSGAAHEAERLAASLRQTPVQTPGGIVFQVTASLGATATEGRGKGHYESLIQTADQALYQAKNRGRNRVEIMRWHGADQRDPACLEPAGQSFDTTT